MAMAYVESSVVVYLRKIYNINNLILQIPRFDPQFGAIELGREAATLVMLLAVGCACPDPGLPTDGSRGYNFVFDRSRWSRCTSSIRGLVNVGW